MARNERSPWQCDTQGAPTVLAAVFEWLGPRDLARAATVCHSWHRAAALPALWRRTLHLPPAAARALAVHRAEATAPVGGAGWWRAEAVRAAAVWRRTGVLRAGGAALHHAALDVQGRLLAAADDDAVIMIWANENDKWKLLDTVKMRVFGWASASRVEWSPYGPQLLAAGPLALATRWETAALAVRDGCASITARVAGAAPGAAWAAPGALLVPELAAGAGLAVTSLRLYAANQRLYSELAAVTEAPLLRVYNEAATHLTHIMIVEPSTWREDSNSEDDASITGEQWPGDAYWAVTAPAAGAVASTGAESCVLLAAGGVRGGPRSEARALLSWPLPPCATLQPSDTPPLPPTELRRRHANRQLMLLANDVDEDTPDEDTVRALCSTPHWVRRLAARVLGLTPAPGKGCVWALTADSYLTCVSLPTLRLLCRLKAGGAEAAPLPSLYLQPSVSETFVTSPVVGGVAIRLAGSGAVGAELAVAGAVAALLVRGQLLVATGAELQCWHSAAGDLYNPTDSEFDNHYNLL